VIAERSTAVFTGLLSQKKSADYPYLTMDEDPLGSGSYAAPGSAALREAGT
jgi:hypothetical protein